MDDTHTRWLTGVEAFPENNQQIKGIDAVTADGRSLPFADGSFQTVIGRRFLHYVPNSDRHDLLSEASRILTNDGILILIEGTLGLYRRLTKGIGFKLGILGEDTDEYGHLQAKEMLDLVREANFEITDSRPLGSPLMPLCILEHDSARKLMGLYNRTQFIRWRTFVVANPK